MGGPPISINMRTALEMFSFAGRNSLSQSFDRLWSRGCRCCNAGSSQLCVHLLPKSKMAVSKKHFLTAVFQSAGGGLPPAGNRPRFLLNLHSTVLSVILLPGLCRWSFLDPTLGSWNSRDQRWMCRLAPALRSLWEGESQFFWLSSARQAASNCAKTLSAIRPTCRASRGSTRLCGTGFFFFSFFKMKISNSILRV